MAVSVHSGSSEPDDNEDYDDNDSPFILNVETVRMHLSAVAARVASRVSLETLRPLSLFLGISASSSSATSIPTGAFTLPVQSLDKHSLEKVKSRVQLNLNFFLSNYALVAAMVGLVVALMHPGMLFFLTGVYALWSLHSFLIRQELVILGKNVGTLLSIQQRFYLLFVITAVVVILKCLGPAVLFVLISSLLILVHAVLRDPKHIQTSSEEVRHLRNSNNSGDARDDFAGTYDEEGGSGGDSSGSEVLVGRPNSRRGDSD